MGTAVSKAVERIGSFQDARNFITMYQAEIQRSAVAQIDPQILVSAILNSVRRTPLLLQCTKISLLSSMIYCAVTGLMPDTPDQECHLIPFKNRDGIYEVQWIGGFRGFQKLARQSGLVTNIETATVYEKDKFYYRRGLEPRLDHEPALTDDRGKAVAYYVVFRFGDASYLPQFEVMGIEEVKKIRASSKAKDGPAWVNWFDEQGRKSVFKRGYKWIPKSSFLVAQAIELDDKAIIGDTQEIHPAAENLLGGEKKKAVDRLNERVNAPELEEEPEVPEETAAEPAPAAPAGESQPETAQEPQKAEKPAQAAPQAASAPTEGVDGINRHILVQEVGELEQTRVESIPDSRMQNLEMMDLPQVDLVVLTAYRDYLLTLPEIKAKNGKKAGAK